MPQTIDNLRKKGMGKPPPLPPQPGPEIKLKVGTPPAFKRFLDKILGIMKVRELTEVVLERKYLYEIIDVDYIKEGQLKERVVNYLIMKGIKVSYENTLVKLRKLSREELLKELARIAANLDPDKKKTV